ncbi:MAG: hypothetical protein QOA17_06005 [Nitrososphaeraceae archaeon]|nr:hypothetical protein [Nitrososphaeraceae archaeon]MDW0168173.1 hypothetical protein [Nitrososphaeraceae archaeon]MDW0173075.1 hypothetical protein [Nitrososphaeraceae archaeon]MDW0180162.1 hypothetical protein [Nitrososphaeraceae archaeon]MDW0187194.1 hypothetical protein [Nitrososphaeraceae archaeon]
MDLNWVASDVGKSDELKSEITYNIALREENHLSKSSIKAAVFYKTLSCLTRYESSH